MIKRILAAVAAVLLCLGGILPATAAGQGWYVMRRPDHCQPVADEQQKTIEKYGGFYVDHTHGDGCTDKVIYLTFDAGYENGNVAKVLDALKAENVPAAFFILKNIILNEPQLLQRMLDEGHTIGNHTMRHKDMTKLSDAEIKEELCGLAELFEEKTGRPMPRYYRPPEGRYDETSLSVAQSLGYKTIFWSFAYADWDNAKQPDPKAAIKRVLDNTHNGAVILLHPTSATNAQILPELLRAWKAEGYRFGTLDELTGGAS